MDRLLKTLGILSIVAGIILGFIQGKSVDKTMELVFGSDFEQGFRWTISIYWWVSGIISGILFYAFGMMIEKLDEINLRLYNIERAGQSSIQNQHVNQLGNSNANLSKLKGFTMGASEKDN